MDGIRVLFALLDVDIYLIIKKNISLIGFQVMERFILDLSYILIFIAQAT